MKTTSPRGRGDLYEMLLEAGLSLASELSLDAVLQRIVELAARITGARYGALGVLGPDGRISRFLTTGISEEQRRAIGHPPVGRGVLGALIREAKPLRLRDVTRDPRSVGFPPHHPPMRSFLGAPVKARGRVFGNIYLTDKQGAEEFSEEDERALVILATQAGVAVENAQLYEEAQLRERRLEALGEITTAILRRADLQAVLELVAGRARELVGGEVATVATPTPQAGTLELKVAVGPRAEALAGTVFPEVDSISGEVIRTGEPVVVPDASSDPRAYQPVVRLGQLGPAVFVPLTGKDRPFGTLAVARRRGALEFDRAAVDLLQSFAAQAAVAIEYARAERELERLRVLEERERIAKELHDGVIQALFAAGMNLQATAAITPDPQLRERLEASVEDIDRVIRDLRNYIFGLRPSILVDRQLDQALRQLVEEFGARTGVVAVAEIDAEVAAALASRAADVVQLTREALSNVGRHAGATTCRVTLRRAAGGSLLEIDDDGKGFDLEAARGQGQGLANLEERAQALGGRLEIETRPGTGTTVRVFLPP